MIRNVADSGHQMSKIAKSERIYALTMHCLRSEDAKKQSTAGKTTVTVFQLSVTQRYALRERGPLSPTA